ncbi:XRE family transcriptional regulator [Alkalihalobacillus alcalophilus ATCC 27647 = CGMCC 1.3604]|uniref:XRE family transcriptional regulator n=1 Tax=Alkalihalobacillus alcalophilus ATCC 27647 = CGMCC 1.3604 TaxID=1218173 RepID=A0A094XHW0_ALKAL|nr:helix-turn-helix transcriptional regulator [Alkalihalobacillus alcalophilus]KGA98365.1 XRE family transcriptional regulator [Alkalihalobacillus alcalophilus ATCC 27647 = CGMCC 1.3604]MED1563664.1 helix-turn-helix transcriptional regulator [Alkalihalobacillus alcalophilus]THG91606.1 XRE family transcriptional regulator [Alkalihalobacillus alcalophilus ATCC 27647 = CGMCC 1.3604]
MLRNRVKELRARHGFSQTELANRVGVTRQTIGFIEKGDFSPSIALSLRLAKHLEIKVDQLFWLEGEDTDEIK